jgi:hypothetical protein
VAKGWDIRYTPDPKPEAGLFFRSDHFRSPSAACRRCRGRPARTGWTAWPAGKKASEDYTAKRYHQQGDEWQPDWVFAGAAARPGSAVHARQPAGQLAQLAELEQGRGRSAPCVTPAPTSANGVR